MSNRGWWLVFDCDRGISCLPSGSSAAQPTDKQCHDRAVATWLTCTASNSDTKSIGKGFWYHSKTRWIKDALFLLMNLSMCCFHFSLFCIWTSVTLRRSVQLSAFFGAWGPVVAVLSPGWSSSSTAPQVPHSLALRGAVGAVGAHVWWNGASEWVIEGNGEKSDLDGLFSA